MRHALLLSVAVLATAAPARATGGLPPEFSYTVYIEGQVAGSCSTTVTETTDTYVMESQTAVHHRELVVELDSKTVVDKQSFLPRRFSYEGLINGKIVSGETGIEGKNASVVMEQDGERYTASRESKHPILFLEEFVMAHEVVIARAFWESGNDNGRYGLLFPSGSNLTYVDITKSSELAFESETQEAYCVKFIVSIQGSTPFASYYDPERGVPVYLAFPGVATEVFLDEFFEGKPVSRYREP
jgi:hypothetical protein